MYDSGKVSQLSVALFSQALAPSCRMFGRGFVTSAMVSILGQVLLPPEARGEPSADDFLPLTATITVLDENAEAMADMEVRAVNHEYGFRASGTTGPDGLITLKLMPGVWSFYAIPTHSGMWSHPGQAYLLVSLDEVFDTSSRSITLAPDSTVAVQLASSIFDFNARENYIGFVIEPYGRFLRAPGVGVTLDDALTLHTNSGLIARAFVVAPRSAGELLFFVQEPMPVSSPLVVEVTSANSSLLAFNARNTDGDPTDYHVQLHTYDLSWEWSPWIADVPAGITAVRVSPHEFYMIRGVDAYDDAATRHRVSLHSIVVNPSAGETIALSIGGPLSVAAIRATPRAAADFAPACQAWLQMQDYFENYVTGVWKWGTGLLKPTIMVHHGAQDSPPFEVYGSFTAKLLKEFDRAEDPSYDISWDFGPWGRRTIVGDLYGQEERRMSIDENASLLSQAPRMDQHYRLEKVRDYQDLADAMQALVGIPVDYKSGVISNIAHAGFEDEVQHGYKLETGIEMDTPTGWLPGSGYIDHEAGHGRIHKPPCRFFAVWVYGEAYATLVGYKARSTLFGGDQYLKYQLGRHDLFLRHQHGVPLTTSGDYIEMMQFATHYINTHYGWQPHRRMILEWRNAFRNLRMSVGSAGYSDIEQFAVVYSWLCGENLGPLFEAAGLSISTARIAAGLAVLQAYLDVFGEPVLAIGVNSIDAPRTSIPIELVACPPPGVTGLETTVTYDASKAAVASVHQRDLTDTAGWSLTADTDRPGAVRLHLSGTTPIVGPGTVAQINLLLLPNASGAIEFTLSDTLADGLPVSSLDGTLTVPLSPLIGPFPTLSRGRLGAWYSTSLWAAGGVPPYSWNVVEDTLPPGLDLDINSGVIGGWCADQGEYLFRIQVSDSQGAVSHRWFTIRVVRAGDYNGDGHSSLHDYVFFADCVGGQGVTPSPTLPGVTVQDCINVFDVDSDADVDLVDFADFQAEFGT